MQVDRSEQWTSDEALLPSVNIAGRTLRRSGSARPILISVHGAGCDRDSRAESRVIASMLEALFVVDRIRRGAIASGAYAMPTTLGELKRYVRDVGWSAHAGQLTFRQRRRLLPITPRRAQRHRPQPAMR